jgi:hypothetical protein
MGQPLGDDTLFYVGLALAVGCVVAQVIVPRALVAAARRGLARRQRFGGDELTVNVDEMLPVFQTQLIVSAALCEGPAFFFLVVYQIQGHTPSLAAAILFAVALALKFPTLASVERWLEEQRELMFEEAGSG